MLFGSGLKPLCNFVCVLPYGQIYATNPESTTFPRITIPDNLISTPGIQLTVVA